MTNKNKSGWYPIWKYLRERNYYAYKKFYYFEVLLENSKGRVSEDHPYIRKMESMIEMLQEIKESLLTVSDETFEAADFEQQRLYLLQLHSLQKRSDFQVRELENVVSDWQECCILTADGEDDPSIKTFMDLITG